MYPGGSAPAFENEFASIVLFPTSLDPRRDASFPPQSERPRWEEKTMFSDRIDYAHPELMPYSDGSDAELVFSWLLAGIFLAVLVAALLS